MTIRNEGTIKERPLTDYYVSSNPGGDYAVTRDFKTGFMVYAITPDLAIARLVAAALNFAEEVQK